MNHPLASRFWLRLTAAALLLLAVGVSIGGMVAAQTAPAEDPGRISRQPPQPAPQITCPPATPPAVVTPAFTPAPG